MLLVQRRASFAVADAPLQRSVIGTGGQQIEIDVDSIADDVRCAVRQRHTSGSVVGVGVDECVA